MAEEEADVTVQQDEEVVSGAEPDVGSEPEPAGPDVEPGTRALHLGDEGPDVAHVQEMLDALDSVGAASGTYDEATEAAVKRYQRLRGLPQDGVVGEETWALLLAPAQESG